MLCCELVSKFCIFVIWNSYIPPTMVWKPLWIGFKILYLCDLKQLKKANVGSTEVVNWFQNFVSLWSETVKGSIIIENSLLWIGFKILYLCDLKQSILNAGYEVDRCELVSKFCIFVIWNSSNLWKYGLTSVVNWFQNFVSLWSETVVYECRL